MFTNILKHAHAHTVEVGTQYTSSDITITIADDGVGFNPAAQRESAQGRGMANLQFRAKALGGKVDVVSPASDDGRGTRVTVRLPLRA